MDKEKKQETATEEATADVEAAEETTEETTEEAETESSTTTDDLDLDKELEEERKRGKPDPKKAKEAFGDRAARRAAEEAEQAAGDEADDDKPLTRKDLAQIKADSYRQLQTDQAYALARGMAASDKEGDLIFEKWNNRTFPVNLPLAEQLEEAYAITHRKKLIGERNEAIRALKNKDTTTKIAPTAHRDGVAAGEPKMSDADRQGYLGAGFVWDGAKRLYKKPLQNGAMHLYKDPKSGRTFTGV